MIVSSFAQQYGIRLEKEKHTIKSGEYRRLLVGLNAETPLGYVVTIRSETDPKKIREMTNHEKQIRAEWQQFRRKQKLDSKIYLSNEDITKVMSKLFS